MKEIIQAQRDYFNTNATKPIDFRIKQLKKLYRVLKDNEQLLNKALYDDFKKSKFDCYTNELALLYHEIHYVCKKLRGWAKVKRVGTNLINFPAKSYVIPEPLGVTLIIGAWNYPFQLSISPIIPAIAAGNTIILKPSELPDNTSHVMAKLFNEAFSPEFFKVVEGGIPETTELLEQKFDKIFFTGSVSVGKIVYQAAAKHLTPVTLELGGKSPAFVTEDCHLKISVKRLIWAKYLNSGQTCVAPDYVFVHKSIKERFLKLAKVEIEKSHFHLDPEHGNYVQIINQQNTERLVTMIDQDKVYFGGNYNFGERYIEPTIMTNVTFDDAVMQNEIFGPILPVIEYSDLDQAIKEVKNRPKPLAAYVFTGSTETKYKILNEISFGGGTVNDALMHITNHKMAFGGVGESGIGAYHGENGFNAFTHYKSILDKPTWFESGLKYYPHNPTKLKWIKRLMGIK